MRPSTMKNVQFGGLILLALLALLYVSWNTAGAVGELVEPTPVCVTVEPDGIGCLIPPVTWVAPTTTPVASPTFQPTSGSTSSPTPTVAVTAAGPDEPTPTATEPVEVTPQSRNHLFVPVAAKG